MSRWFRMRLAPWVLTLLSSVVAGTVFLVDAEEAGSHVSVIQTEVKVMPAARLQFAGASLRTLPPSFNPTRVRCMGVDGELFPMPLLDPDPIPRGRCTGGRVFVETLVATAYASSADASIATYRVIGVPDALKSPLGYEIQGIAEDPARVTKAELQRMLQTLLVDRFNAKIHRETREMDGYVMTVAKSGIKFKATLGTPDVPRLVIPTGLPSDRIPAGITRAATGPAGGLIPLVMKGNFSLAAVTTTIVELLAGTPVIDRTGLADLYDISLNLEQFGPRQQVEGVRGACSTAAQIDRPRKRPFHCLRDLFPIGKSGVFL